MSDSQLPSPIIQNNVYTRSPAGVSAFRQAEILTNVLVPVLIAKSERTDLKFKEDPDLIADLVKIDYAIIVSQDCDLNYDFDARSGEAKAHKLMRHVLLCELELADKKLLWAKQQRIYTSSSSDTLRQNRHERLHFLPIIPKEQDVCDTGLGELVADFKLIYSIDPVFLTAQLRQQHWDVSRRTILNTPYKEHFCQRFYQYHSRIGLPEQYSSI